MTRFPLKIAVVIASVASLLPTTARADPGIAIGAVTFGCQIKMTFPATNQVPKTNCAGFANGLLTATGSKPGAIAFTGVPNRRKLPLGLDPKCQPDCRVNFRVDNITYTQPCAFTGEPPIFGSATGTFGIQGYYPLTYNAPVFVRGAFSYVRIGALWLATLSNVGAANGFDTKNMWPTGTGIGVATGVFVPKLLTETLGVCGAPQQNNFDIYGVAVLIAAPPVRRSTSVELRTDNEARAAF